MKIKVICTINFISVCAVILVAEFCGVAADSSDCNFENKQGFFYVRVHVIFFNVSVCIEKLKGQMMNSDLILKTIYLFLDNKIFLNKICV